MIYLIRCNNNNNIGGLHSKEDNNMGVSYNKLFKLLIDRGMKKKDLQERAGISSASITKLAKNECVRMEVLIKICKALEVDFGDIMCIVR
jgi:DNA-binding Xre family transcriptional regulator